MDRGFQEIPRVTLLSLKGNNIACKEALNQWNSDVLMMVWVVRWTAKGLVPMKPTVHLRGELIFAGWACLPVFQAVSIYL